ncbi:sensor histidine kinase [Jiangella endophytica]|uniref:sensor histidine kinase n=1 Tax=Jiangella endophytica TaxID=1623398 RepID=UPI000E34D56B|nr:HAMP domain-containing sensor histidine kinase [Jiangella endophytica]
MTSGDDVQVHRGARRLAALLTLLIVVLLAGVAALVLVIVARSQAEDNRHLLADTARTASVDDAPPGVFVAVLADGRLLLSSGMPDGLPDRDALEEVARTGHPVERDVDTGDKDFLVRTTHERGRIVQVAVDQHENAEELTRLAWALAIAGLAAVLVAALIAAWMARRAMAPLAASLALQRRFIADASHELRTPLTLLRTRAQLLQLRVRERPDLDEPVGAGVDEIVTDAQRLTDILEDLLLAADPREVVDDTPVDLVALADETVRSHRAEADRRGLRLDRTGATTPVTIRGSRVSLARLCSALVWNALDHARSTVTVTVETAGQDAQIRISDDGPGFPPGTERQAFERFAGGRRSGDSTGQRHYGLGLALVAEVAHRHGGDVRAGRDEGSGGAVVTVRLPRQP